MKKVVVVSDLHLGEEGSILNDRKVISSFVDELKTLGEIDEFVMLGDILDLSMASFPESVKSARVFFEELAKVDIKEIVYVPGNHDHHLWVLEVEYASIIQKMQSANLPDMPNYIKEFRGTSSFISGICPNSLKNKLIVKYPNHKVDVMGKTGFLHHGHYLSREGSLLCKVSEAIKEGVSLNEFELQNSPIHELIQYSLEQSPVMQGKIEKAWKGGGSLAGILVVADEIMDGQGFWGWLIRRFTKEAQKGKKHSMRGAAIDDEMVVRARNYKQLCKDTSDWFIFGHTHIPEGRIGEFSLVNAGSWLDEGEGPPNTYVVIDDKVVIRRLGDTNPYWLK